MASHRISFSIALLVVGCVDNFDPRLYQAREAETGPRDGGVDAPVPGDDAGTDAGDDAATIPDGGSDGGSDAGIPSLTLADFCSSPSSVPMIPRPASPTDAVSTAYLIDTNALLDDSADVAACTGAREPGRDGFASVMMMRNERWHFHLRRPTGANAALYILDSACDERTCSGGQGQDLCGTSSDEHFSFVAPADGLYFLAVDNETANVGFTGELDVIHPVCGNHAREHSEGCDDGGTVPGDGCDAACRTELASGASESEANDDPYSANHLVLATVGPTTVIGHVASACESDVFAFDVPAGEVGNVTVSLALSTGGCPTDDTVPITLSVLSPDGSNVLATTTLGAGGGCPMIGGTGSTLTALAPGTYYARVRSIGTMAPDRPFDYRLSIDAVLTP